MAHVDKLPKFQRLITTHDASGKAILSDALSTDPPINVVNTGDASFLLSYTTTEFPVDMNGDKDIDVYKSYIEKPPGIVQNSGSVLRAVDMAPNHLSPMHRTVSLDYGIVILGEVELVLDSGETKVMKQGDVCIQRGTMHAWRNTSSTEWARMLFVLQPSKPVEVGGEKLGEELGTMTGVPKSS